MIDYKVNPNRIENDFYAINPKCVRGIAELENIKGLNILETSAGTGNISKELQKYGNQVFSVDLVDRGFPLNLQTDFLQATKNQIPQVDVAVYNPPFKHFNAFVEKTWDYTDKQIVFGRLQILETSQRYNDIFSKGYLSKAYVYVKRQTMMGHDKTNAMAFAWFVLDKNNRSDAIIKWIGD